MSKKDLDWLNKDSIYRSESDANYLNVFDQLSDILSKQQIGYKGFDVQKEQDAQAQKLAGQQQAANAAARGLGRSGITKTASEGVLKAGQQQRDTTQAQEDEFGRQYGARNAMAEQMGASFSLKEATDSKNYTELAKVFGLLGSLGTSAGTSFRNAMSKSAGEAANRGSLKAFDYLKGWQ